MRSLVRSRWAAIGAAVAVTLGAGGLVGVNAANTSSTLVPITPTRVLDTRSGARVGSLDIAGSSSPYRLKVTGAGDIPATGVTGVSLNVTAVDTQANDYGGYVTIYPCASTSSAKPDVSNLNFVSGQTLANAVTVPVSGDGYVCFYVYGTAHLLADANGYYTESSASVDAYTKGETDTLMGTKADQTDLYQLVTDVDTLTDTVNTKLDANTFQHHPTLPTTLDSDGIVGYHTSIAIGVNGNPIISYFDAGHGDLKVAACDNPTCATSTNTTIDSDGIVGYHTSIAIGVNGNPIISYYDATERDLKVAACNDPTCTTSTNTTLDSNGDVGYHTSIAIGVNGNPIISYHDATNDDLKVAACNDPTCTTSTNTTLDSDGDVGYHSSIAIGVNGNPIISYFDAGLGDLKVAACDNPTCTTSTNTTLDSDGIVGYHSSIAIGVNGNPIISYHDATNRDLKVAACNDPTCATSTNTTIDSDGWVGEFTSIAIGVNGNPIISYYDDTNTDLKVAACNNPTCTTSTEVSISTIDSNGDVGWYTSIAIGVNGNPIISYYDDTNSDLKVANLWWLAGGR